MYYMPCANGHGISLPRGVAHSRFFSVRNNHPTISSTANNNGNRIPAARTGRARVREDEGEGGRGGDGGRTATRGGRCDLVLHALCERARNISSVRGRPLEVLFHEKQPPNNIQNCEQYRESNSGREDREGEAAGGRRGRGEGEGHTTHNTQHTTHNTQHTNTTHNNQQTKQTTQQTTANNTQRTTHNTQQRTTTHNGQQRASRTQHAPTHGHPTPMTTMTTTATRRRRTPTTRAATPTTHNGRRCQPEKARR